MAQVLATNRLRLKGEASSKCTEILGPVLAALQTLLRLQKHAIPSCREMRSSSSLKL